MRFDKGHVTGLGSLLRQPSAWLGAGGESEIIISTRVRLARNLRDAAFPGWAGEDECERLWQRLAPVLQELPSLGESFAVSMGELSELDRLFVLERRLASREHVQQGRGSGLVVKKDETVSIMVNEEDHLRLQAMRPGFRLKETWNELDRIDTEISRRVEYAFSPKLGFLTACPSNVGTGLRASVMLHLPGLVLIREMEPIIKGLGKIGLAVRGLWGEGTEARGNLFQVSNQITLGEKEEEIVEGLSQIVQELVVHEKNARARLMEKDTAVVRDHVGRAWGILCHAHVLSSDEAVGLLSSLRLGCELGILDAVDRAVVDELWLLTQPAHLQKLCGRTLGAAERDRVRAELVRERLAKAKKQRPRSGTDG